MRPDRNPLLVVRVGAEFWIVASVIDSRALSADAALRHAMRVGPLGRYATLRAAADARAALAARIMCDAA